jgi:hypothetical protein
VRIGANDFVVELERVRLARLAAIRDALDRAGLKPIAAIDLDISTKTRR